MEVMQKHYNHKSSVIVQCYQFNTHNNLKCHLVKNCELGTTPNTMFRNRLVYGVEEPRIQRHLLAEPDLTSEKNFELASASEAVNRFRNAKDL